MHHHIGGQVFFGLSKVRRAAILPAVLMVSACATASIDDAVPVAATTPQPVATTTTAAPMNTVATTTAAPTTTVATTTAAPVSAAAPVAGAAQPAAQTAAAATPPGGPVNTGRYPNLNVTPPSATTILTPEETAAKTAEITAARDALAARDPGTPADEQAKLKKLAATHADETLKKIEGK
jgi:hypothetical protein